MIKEYTSGSTLTFLPELKMNSTPVLFIKLTLLLLLVDSKSSFWVPQNFSNTGNSCETSGELLFSIAAEILDFQASPTC